MEQSQWDEYASTYHKYIISPFQTKVVNPLFSDISRLPGTQELVVADIGTGIGDLLPFLSDKFKEVHAIDFSEKMLETARQKHGERKNILFEQADIRELGKLGLKLDIAIASNSILHPHFEDVNRTLQEIRQSLNDGGLFIGIFPSMEALLYNFMLVYEREFQKSRDEKKAQEATRRIVEQRKYDFIRCLYDDHHEQQKFYYEFELKTRLKQAGFKNIRFKRVLYPWGEQSGAYEDFVGMDEMWDWYVLASK